MVIAYLGALGRLAGMKHYILLIALFATCTFVVVPTSVSAQEEKRPSLWKRIFGTAEKTDKEEVAEETKSISKKVKAEKPSKKEKAKESTYFSNEEREVLESWQKGNAKWKKSKKPLPPGLQKKVARGGELPPGWKKKLEVGTVLDPELDQKAESLPEEILKRLPKTPDGTEIIKIGDEVIRIYENSREIIDILSGIRTRTPKQD